MSPLFSNIEEAALRCVGGFVKSDKGTWFRVSGTQGDFLCDEVGTKVHWEDVTEQMFKPFYFIYAKRLCRMSRLPRRRPWLQALAGENCTIYYTNEKGDRWAGQLDVSYLREAHPINVGEDGVTFHSGDFIIFRGFIYYRLTLIGTERDGVVNLTCDSIISSLFMSKYNVK